jgi:hypothetical protein
VLLVARPLRQRDARPLFRELLRRQHSHAFYATNDGASRHAPLPSMDYEVGSSSRK